MVVDWSDLIRMHLEVEELERQLAQAKYDLGEMKRAALSELDEARVTSVKSGGFTIYKQTTIRASALEGNHDALNEALRLTGNASIIQERANSKTLEKLVRDYLRTNGKLPDALDAAVTVYPQTGLNLKRS